MRLPEEGKEVLKPPKTGGDLIENAAEHVQPRELAILDILEEYNLTHWHVMLSTRSKRKRTFDIGLGGALKE